jgi:hypothetical protein
LSCDQQGLLPISEKSREWIDATSAGALDDITPIANRSRIAPRRIDAQMRRPE